jgi:Zn-dependent M28 family amino/carboxypeptidase
MLSPSAAKVKTAAAVFATVALAGIVSCSAALAQTAAPGAASEEGALRHLRALQAIAAANGGNRAAGTAGFDRSADYVADRLKEAGYRVSFEEFDFPFFEERKPPVLAVSKPDTAPEAAPEPVLRTLSNSGSGDVSAALGAVNLGLGAEPPQASNSGCDAADFRDFRRGAVALVRRGTCTFQVKVGHAVAAGAVGVIIMNEGTDGRKDRYSGQLGQLATVPVVGVSYEFGRTLEAAARGGASVRVAVDAVTGRRPTRNVLAETTAGGGSPWIIVGAHLDSVPEGPGINDNGSGSAAVLEAAVRAAPQLQAARVGVRFAFWGAEERGLIGSRHHVAALSEEQRRRIALYVNLDMVGSPNYARYVQGTAATGDGLAARIRTALVGDFADRNLPIEERAGGRTGTDDASFSEKSIPTLGLYTGAGGPKSEAHAGLFGGAAGKPYDPCYHRACDTVENINREVLEQNTRALVRALDVVAGEATARGPDSKDKR